MHQYTAFGLGIHSHLELPELSHRPCSADVIIRRGRLDGPSREESADEPLVRAEVDRIYLFWPEVGAMLVTGGREIVVDALPHAEAPTVRHIVQGMALGLLLHQRGYLTLHASAVAIGDRVAGFIGWKGAGKSTTAGALHARGHTHLTDDVLAVTFDEEDGRPLVVPGVPLLSLWPDAAEALGTDPETLPRIYGPSPKRVRALPEVAPAERLPLGCIYLLEELPDDVARTTGEPVVVEPMRGREAFVALVQHSHALRIVAEQGATPDHLARCTRLVRQVPVRRLRRTRSLDHLSRIAEIVAADLYA